MATPGATLDISLLRQAGVHPIRETKARGPEGPEEHRPRVILFPALHLLVTHERSQLRPQCSHHSPSGGPRSGRPDRYDNCSALESEAPRTWGARNLPVLALVVLYSEASALITPTQGEYRWT
jgi:hypothetical protein